MFRPLPMLFIIQLGNHLLQCLVDMFNCAIHLWDDMAMYGVS